MHLRTDTSKFVVGGVSFEGIDGVWKLQIVQKGHKSLEGLFTQKMTNRRLAWCYDILPEYPPTFAYLPGAKNGIADALSRRSDFQPEIKFFHDLKRTRFDDPSFRLAISEVTTDTELVTKIKKTYLSDTEITQYLQFGAAFCQHVFKSIGTTLSMTYDWDVHYANAEFAVNPTVNYSIKLASFQADLGYVPKKPLQLAAEQLTKPYFSDVVEPFRKPTNAYETSTTGTGANIHSEIEYI
ncbi:hypothetical protein PHMEG_00031224 [Phytophthora megakarya]|uniref:Reverse transcriptase RNase H-like domain-containing protein n=1 Tax=Phytophthora megakarya TaxID=4795 RepID=A0A225V0Y5_9STRA|nr:hypothetical protein PHMEG_00031224 [Phytophthora megakarya]